MSPDPGDSVLQPIPQPKRVSTAENSPGIFPWHPEEKTTTSAELSSLGEVLESLAGAWLATWRGSLSQVGEAHWQR